MRQEEEVKRLDEETCVHSALNLFALLPAYMRIHPSVGLVEGRHPDRRDEAARATLVSSIEHHPSSWELSA